MKAQGLGRISGYEMRSYSEQHGIAEALVVMRPVKQVDQRRQLFIRMPREAT